MVKKSRHGKSRKMKHTRRSRRTLRVRRRRGGSAPVAYSLSGSWPSRMSLGQGQDFFKYHEGQHGGAAPYPMSVEGSGLPDALRGPAHLSGIDQAMSDIRGLRDDNQMGGRRRRHKKSHKKSKKSKKSHKKGRKSSKKHRKSHRRTRRRGGALGYAPVSAPGMLLSGREYAQAGLNPEWKSAIEFTDANIRDTQ